MSGPLANESWKRLSYMALTGEGDTEDPLTDAIVELGHRAQQRDELLAVAIEARDELGQYTARWAVELTAKLDAAIGKAGAA